MNEMPILTKEDIDALERSKKALNKQLKSLFSGQITVNFMLEIMWKMITIHPEIGQYLPTPDMNQVLSGKMNNLFYVLCVHIVGIHRSRIIFLDDTERVKLENSTDYQKELMDEVYTAIKLRYNIEGFLKNEPLIRGDKFIYFPVPYYLAVLNTKLIQLIPQLKSTPGLFMDMSNKALASLSLLQDGFVDSAYPICRIIIEEYINATIFKNCPAALAEYEKFSFYDLKHSIGYDFDDEFLDKFDNRLNKVAKNRVQFLHFGWVDVIPKYHEVVKQNPYTFSGVKDFLLSKLQEDAPGYTDLQNLEYYHTMCSGYSHGSISYSKYQILHYFEISTILTLTITNVYFAACEELGIEKEIDGIDVIGLINKHYQILKVAESKKSTENFERYYKNFNNHLIK